MFTFSLSCGQTVDKNILPVHQTAWDAEVKQKRMVQIWQGKEAIFCFSSFQRAEVSEETLAWLEDITHSFYGLKPIIIW